MLHPSCATSPQLSQEPNPHLITGPQLTRCSCSDPDPGPGWDSSARPQQHGACRLGHTRLRAPHFPARGLHPQKSHSPLDVFDLGIVVCLASCSGCVEEEEDQALSARS